MEKETGKITIDIKCDECTHKDVCAYKKEVTDFQTKNICEEELPACINITATCKYFKENTPTVRGFSFPNYPSPPTAWPSNMTCDEDCWFYKTYIKTGKTYIGDSPCTFCSKYPFHITYSGSDSISSSTNSTSDTTKCTKLN